MTQKGTDAERASVLFPVNRRNLAPPTHKCIRTKCTLKTRHFLSLLTRKIRWRKRLVGAKNFSVIERHFVLHKSNSWNRGVNYRSIDNFSIFYFLAFWFLFSSFKQPNRKLEFHHSSIHGSVSWMNECLSSLLDVFPQFSSCNLSLSLYLFLTHSLSSSCSDVINNKFETLAPSHKSLDNDSKRRRRRRKIHSLNKKSRVLLILARSKLATMNGTNTFEVNRNISALSSFIRFNLRT